ncbi:MAG: DUF1501 domain-containing protein, partial [Phycisphaerae bacterium]|nr:DUF1501 domain-containing protein [Phycisphaerae bacterium]
MSIDRDPAGTKPLGMAGPWASRRQLLLSAGGLGPLSLLDLLLQDPASAAAKTAAAGRCHFAPKARSVIMLFCPGGVSQVDTYDHKPELERLDGKKFDRPGEFFAKSPTVYRRSHFPFTRHGQCGRPLSSLFPRLGQCVDDMAFIHSMTVHSAIHGPATFLMNTGFAMPGFPAMGAWMSYGLGRETDNLPTFVVLPDPRGLPPGGPRTWGAGFLPAIHQGTALATESGRDPIADLFAPQGAKLDAPGESATRNFLRQLNQLHLQQRSGNSDLAARIAAYEMAARLQLSAPEATDLGRESPATRQLYG